MQSIHTYDAIQGTFIWQISQILRNTAFCCEMRKRWRILNSGWKYQKMWTNKYLSYILQFMTFSDTWKFAASRISTPLLWSRNLTLTLKIMVLQGHWKRWTNVSSLLRSFRVLGISSNSGELWGSGFTEFWSLVRTRIRLMQQCNLNLFSFPNIVVSVLKCAS